MSGRHQRTHSPGQDATGSRGGVFQAELGDQEQQHSAQASAQSTFSALLCAAQGHRPEHADWQGQDRASLVASLRGEDRRGCPGDRTGQGGVGRGCAARARAKTEGRPGPQGPVLVTWLRALPSGRGVHPPPCTRDPLPRSFLPPPSLSLQAPGPAPAPRRCLPAPPGQGLTPLLPMEACPWGSRGG